ncbi:hypothetical protein [Oceanisphaera avium]|uniref:Uncharacterized protein n=1 Tax=Oceanisphaera avium TaxID=1903694 RepID=A0A1Y0CWE4_9GAMM|nr:hypothetical protein [Oceanisphaera avium]ART79538.1 hypothetical protein CBP12_04720 [Oceanisphaera avium]
MKNKATKSKKYGVIGWFIYVLSLFLGAFGYVGFSVFGFTLSYIILFLWMVHYEITQLDKGTLMITSGTFFVLILSAALGLEIKESQIFDVPENLNFAFIAIVTIAGATFIGAGGSVIANVATAHSIDSPINIAKENKISTLSVEKQLKVIYRLLLIIILLVSIFIILLTGLAWFFYRVI